MQVTKNPIINGSDFLNGTPGTTPLTVLGITELANGSKVVLLANAVEDYFGMANLANLSVAIIDINGNVSTSLLTDSPASILEGNSGETEDYASIIASNDGGFIVASCSAKGFALASYTSTGSLTTTFTLPTGLTQAQVDPQLKLLQANDGSFVFLTSNNSGETIQFQRYDAAGNALGSWTTKSFATGSAVIEKAALDSAGNLAIPVTSTDGNTQSSVSIWNGVNTLIGNFSTAFYQDAATIAARPGGGFTLFGRDTDAGVANAGSGYHTQSLAANGSTGSVTSNVVAVKDLKSVALMSNGLYLVVGGDDAQTYNAYELDATNPNASNLNPILNDADKLSFPPVLGKSGRILDVWVENAQKTDTGIVTAGSLSLVTYTSNQAPSTETFSRTINEDNSYTLLIGDFSFSDPDAGQNLEGVNISRLPSLGTLKLNGADVTLNQTISKADIIAGLLVYAPATNGNGASYANFGFKVSDGIGLSAEASASFNVTAQADAPSAAGASINLDEDTNYALKVSDFNFNDPDSGDQLSSITITQLPAAGHLKFNGVAVTVNQVILAADISSGKLTFTPAADAFGTNYTSFKYTVSDGALSSTEATFQLDVNNVNDPPVLTVSGTIKVIEDTPTSITELSFSDIDSNNSSFFIQINVNTGTLSAANGPWISTGQTPDGKLLSLYGTRSEINQFISDQRLIYTPETGDTSNFTLTFYFEDGDGGSVNQTLTIDIVPKNLIPTTQDATLSVAEDTPVTLTLAKFAFNDGDNGDTLQSVQISQLPSAGTLTLNGIAVTQGQSISVTDIQNNKLVFQAAANGNGAPYTSLSFKVSDGKAWSDAAQLNITVTPINDAPTSSNTNIRIDEDSSHVFLLANFPFNDVDVGNTLQSITISSLPTAGTLKLNGNAVTLNQSISSTDIGAGKLIFSPDANANGNNYSSFDFKVSDGTTLSTAASFTINVNAINDAPTTNNSSITVNEDQSIALQLSDFPFTDIDTGDNLQSIAIISLPSKGSFKLNGNAVTLNQVISASDINAGKLVFTPAANANGSNYANFDFKVNDGTASSTTANLKINVTPVNDAPSTIDASITINEDQNAVLKLSDFPFSDIDAGDSMQSITISSLPNAGSLKLNGNAVTLNQVISANEISAGNLVFSPAANANGNNYASFEFKVSDGTASSNVANVNINVTTINDAPITNNAIISTNEDQSVALKLSDFSFSDVDAGDTLQSITITSLTTAGTLTINGNAVSLNQVIVANDIAAGKLMFTPAASAYGNNYATFEFKVSDGTQSSTSASLTINVTPINDAPSTNHSSLTINEDQNTILKLTDFPFSDIDNGDSLQAIIITNLPSNGSLKLNGNAVAVNQVISATDIALGKLVFTPASNANGANYSNLSFKVSDGIALSNVATMTINVTPTNDAPTGVLSIQGSIEKGQTISINNTLADADGLGNISYQWFADGALISGANSTSLLLDRYLVGKKISVQATYIDSAGTFERVQSAQTNTVFDPNAGFSGNAYITGQATQGETLTATHNLNDPDGMGTVVYQWNSNGLAITGANQATLKLDESLVGKLISVTAAFIDGKGNLESTTYGLHTIVGNNLQGGSTNEVFKGTAGHDIINGGAGADTVQFNGKLADYTIKNVNGKFVVSDKAGKEGVDTLNNIETLKFTDMSMNLTIQGKLPSAPSSAQLKLIELYIAFFNRIPDADGLSYWIDQLNGGMKLDQIAESFYKAGLTYSKETGYTSTMSNADFVNIVYKNTLGRKEGADADGLKYWSEQLATGKATRGSLVNEILNSAHSFKGKADFGWVADLLDNKVTVGKTIAVDWGINFNTPEESISKGMAIAAAVTATDYQAALKLVGINSSDISLTGVAPLENGLALM